jgi:signal transduction histidine kinase
MTVSSSSEQFPLRNISGIFSVPIQHDDPETHFLLETDALVFVNYGMTAGSAAQASPRSTDPLAGGGEMGALMRTIDWAQTPLGPVASWPTSLRTMVGVALGNRFPTLIWWSREFVQLYNDGYRVILGAKHPQAMGRSGAETWAEIWDIVGPMATGILDGGPSTWSEHLMLPINRKGYIEEAYFTFSYSPIPDDDGQVGGVLVTVQETTAQVLDARQLRSLRDLGARSAGDARSPVQACQDAVRLLGENDADVPFALLYLLDAAGTRAELAGSTGLAGYQGSAGPSVIALPPATDGADKEGGEDRPWPLAEAIRTGLPVLVDDLADRVGVMPGGRWSSPPRAAVIVPLARAGQATPYGFLIAGLSPRRAVDESYLGFFRLAADQIATVIASARAHEEARQRAEALAALDRAKMVFFSNVSHEFRTPLTLMLGPLEEALGGPAPLAGAPLEMVHRNALRLLKLVNTLLEFARIEAGRLQANFVPVDIAQFTADLASVFRSAVERAGLRFTITVAAPTIIHLDRDLWECVVLNLLSNALKFTFAGEIRLTTRATAEGAEIEVCDTGAGIPADELPRLFERFHRVEAVRARTHEGSGIGLAMVHEIVRMHGGQISVSSVLGEGTRFTIQLPAGTAHLPADRVGEDPARPWISRQAASFVEEALRWVVPDAAGPGDAVEPPGLSEGAKILFADDNADMRDYVARILRQQGWRVTTVPDGQAALASLRAGSFDLVLSDVMMPVLDGRALLQAIRADHALRATPVILLSARAGQESRVDALDGGADDYLVKPFLARELVARIGSQLTLAALRRDSARERGVLENRAMQALREAQVERQHASWLFMQMPMPIVILRGPDFVIQLANPATCKVWRRTVDQLIDRPLVEAMPELRDQPFLPLLQQVYRIGQPYSGSEVPAHLDSSTGEPRKTVYFNFTYAPLRNAEGQTEGVLVVAADVTEQVEARHDLDELRGAAEAANRAKDEFLAMLGHELRNPLSPILTALHLLRLRGDRTREHEVIERQVTHLVRLVDDLLDVARITQRKIQLRKKRLEVATVILRAVEMATPMLEQRQQRLTLDVPPEGLPVLADPDRMAQVISNLLTNASKYSDPGTAVHVMAVVRAKTVIIGVRDEGIGIAPEMLDHIFEAFVQQRQSIDRSGGGLGLGLSIVRSLVAMHDGRVTATSQGRGKGSEFSIELPLAEAEDGETHVALSGHGALAVSRSKRVLIVDDNHDAATLIGDWLDNLGFEVRVAHDGPSALAMAETFRPNIALLDIGLPVMDGYELGKRLREVMAGADLRLVAVTGYGQDSDRKRSSEAGFAAHLVKPVDIDLLTKVLLN